jgi:hypothetical protein
MESLSDHLAWWDEVCCPVTPRRQKRGARTFKRGEDILRSTRSILLGSRKYKVALIERKQVARDKFLN